MFAIEKNSDAFKTLQHNLIDTGDHNRGKQLIEWPDWLDKTPEEIRSFINRHRSRIRRLRGSIPLIVGGPPCQGFSFAGRRSRHDPRNRLFKAHLELVDLMMPQLVLLENVQGINTAFGAKESKRKRPRGRPRRSYASRIRDALAEHGYYVQQELVRAVDFGVPQLRQRYFTVGIRVDMFAADEVPDFFNMLRDKRKEFLRPRGLPLRRPVTASEAISDLATYGSDLVECIDPDSPPGFKEIIYSRPKSPYQRLMHGGMNGRAINSLRLVNHRPETIRRFKAILRTCRKGVQLTDKQRARLGIRKMAMAPLAPDSPSHTLTTIPDDLLHYAEPRVHTVREHARLQSFPDWFEFQGKYTTGGDRRARECPRYTQVGNAVPPLLAEAIGEALLELLRASNLSVPEGQARNSFQPRSAK